MKFHVSASHVRQQNRRAIYFALFLAVVIAVCIVMLLNSKTLSDTFFPAIGIFLFAPPIFKAYKRVKEGASSYPVIELDETTGKIAVSHKDVTVIVNTTQVKNLRLQYKSERLVSVIVTTSSGETMRFQGYENLETLASVLEQFTPKESVTNAKFYHR